MISYVSRDVVLCLSHVRICCVLPKVPGATPLFLAARAAGLTGERVRSRGRAGSQKKLNVSGLELFRVLGDRQGPNEHYLQNMQDRTFESDSTTGLRNHLKCKHPKQYMDVERSASQRIQSCAARCINSLQFQSFLFDSYE